MLGIEGAVAGGAVIRGWGRSRLRPVPITLRAVREYPVRGRVCRGRRAVELVVCVDAVGRGVCDFGGADGGQENSICDSGHHGHGVVELEDDRAHVAQRHGLGGDVGRGVAGRVDAGQVAARCRLRVAGVCGAVGGTQVSQLAGGKG